MKKSLIIFSLGLCIGFAAAYYLHIKPDQTQRIHSDSLESFGKNFSDEMNDYIRIQDANEKYKRAEEMLGKMMTLFLANVSIHFDPNVKKYFYTAFDNRTQKLDTTEKIKVRSKPSNEIPAPKDDEKEQGIYTVIDIPFNTITNEEFRGPFVKTRHQVINNSFLYFKNAKLATSKKIADEFSGEFLGLIYVLKGNDKGLEYNVRLNINLQITGETISGSYLSELSKDGKPFSTNRGDGSNNHIKQAGNEKEYLLSTSPSSYMQLFKRDDNYYYGSYYDNDEYVGIVIINRN